MAGLQTCIIIITSVVGFFFHPAPGVSPQQEFARLIKDKDEEGEGKGREPPGELQRVHLQSLVHAGSVGQEGCQEGFKYEAKVHHPVLHALLEHRKLPCLANDQVGPLNDNY